MDSDEDILEQEELYDIEEEEEHEIPLLFPEVPIDEFENDEIVSDLEDDDDYGEMPVLDPEVNMDEEERVIFGTDGTAWTERPPNPRRRVPVQNIVRAPPGPTNAVPLDVDLMTMFRLILTNDMVDLILRYTNQYGEHVIATYNQEHPLQQPKAWKPIDDIELMAFIGLNLWLGSEHAKKTSVELLWTTDVLHRRPICPATFGRDRFKLLMKCLRFDDALERRNLVQRYGRAHVPKARPVSELLQMLNAVIPLYFEPGRHITVDETLLKFRGKAPFRVYIKSKPGRYGLKLWNCVGTNSSYVLGVQLYEGKGERREVNQGQRVVMDLAQRYFNTGRGITTDNFFTSLSLARSLWQNGLTIVGTIRTARREVPRELRTKQNRDEFSSKFVFNDHTSQTTLVSYKPQGRKNVVLALSTEHHDAAVSDRPDRKPEIILTYNATKGGVDAADQLMAEYTCSRPTKRWPMKVFFGILDIIALNTYKAFIARNPAWNVRRRSRRQLALRELGMELMWPQHQRRAANVHFRHVRVALEAVSTNRNTPLPFPEPEQPQLPPVPLPGGRPQFGRCHICPGPVNRRLRSRTQCAVCRLFACNQHKEPICNNCIRPLQ